MRIVSALSLTTLATTALLIGCGAAPSVPTQHSEPAAITGKVHGGQLPITGATIQLYTVGTTGDGSAATPLLTSPVTTDGSGNFNITGDYSCSAATQVYLTSTGGYATPTLQNPNVVLMAALGPCSSLSASTNVTLDELTTVAAVNALYPYMTSATAVGSSSSDATALASAFNLAAELVNIATGIAPGTVPSGFIAPTNTINTLGDTMAICVNSGGGSANDGTLCGTFFANTTPPGGSAPTDTVLALIALANNPTLNTSYLYNNASPTSPFQPTLTAQPTNFTIALTAVPMLTLSPTSIAFGSVTEGTFPPSVPVTITNTGASAVTIGAIAVTGSGASQFYDSSNCGTTLAAGAFCTVEVSAFTSASGSQSANLVVMSTGLGSPQSVGLAATGVAPGTAGTLKVSTPITWTFGGTYQDLTLTNAGTVPIVFTASTQTANFATNGVGDCSGVIPAQAICQLAVESLAGATVSPTTLTDTLTITSNASNPVVAVPLTSTNYFSAGMSIASAACCSYGATANFGEVALGSSVTGTFTATQPHPPNYEGYYGSFAGTNPGDFTAPNCVVSTGFGNCNGQQTLICAAGSSSSCTGPVIFKPSGTGTRSAKMFIGGTYIPLTGSAPAGTNFALVSSNFVGTMFVYNGTPASGTGTVTLTNTGVTTLNATSFALSGANPSNFAVTANNCSAVASLATCTISMSFTGPAMTTYTAMLTVTDVSTGVQETLPLSTTVFYVPMLVSPMTLNFPNQPIGTTSAAQSFTVSDIYGNPLGHAITISTSIPVANGFGFPNGASCPASTTQTCVVSVTFSPTSAVTADTFVYIKDTVTGNLGYVELVGTGYTPPVITATPGTYTFSSQPVNTSAGTQFVLTSPVAATYSSVTLSGAVNGNFTMTNGCTGASTACTIAVTFAPTARGTQTVTITAVSNATNSPTTLTLTGTAY